jgi:signal transduction histidine kinase
MRELRLQHRLTLIGLLPVAFFGVVVTLVSIYAFQQISLNLILQRNTALVQVAAAGVANDLNAYLGPLQTAASALARHVGAPDRQEQVLREWAPFLDSLEGGVALLDERGVAIATTPGHEQRKGLDYSFRSYFQTTQATGHPVFSAVLAEKPSGQDAVVISTPVSNDDEFAGVLIGVLFLGHHPWSRNLEPLRTPQGGQTYLVDTTGNVIYHPDAARIGDSIEEDLTLSQLLAEGRPASLLYDSPFSGERVVVSFAPLPDVGWGLIMEEPWRAILAPTVPYQWAVGGLLTLGVILSVALLVFSVSRATRPLTDLVQEAMQVSTGATFHPLRAQGPPEVHTLIGVFNRMVIRLAEQQATLRQYAIQVLESQEEERKRISRELHDETVQDLVGLVQRIELCRSAMQRDPTAARQRLDELQSLVEGALADMRRMSNDLRPFILEDLGLSAALQAVSEESAQYLPAARFHCEIVGDERRLAAELELTVFRVVQEALTNIRKHTPGATQVNVTLYFEEWGVLVTVEDNGSGFQSPDIQTLARHGHLGLAGMYERANLFDGELSITSAPGEGTTITLHLPSPREREG